MEEPWTYGLVEPEVKNADKEASEPEAKIMPVDYDLFSVETSSLNQKNQNFLEQPK